LKVYQGLGELPARRRPTAITIGNFDGVHRGHLSLIRRLQSHSASLEVGTTVVTFDPHPQQVLRGISPTRLVTPEEKLDLLDQAGIDQVVIIQFNHKLSLVEPEEFVERVLVNELSARAIVVGAVFRFGHRARGDVAMLRSMARSLGYRFEAFRLTQLAGRTVSSTGIRYAIAEGDLAWANRALGRPYRLHGEVIRGSGRGRGLGFPTANLRVDLQACLPAIGIYAAWLGVGRNSFKSAVSIGTNPTFGKNPVSVEAHVLDFEGDLYGREVSLEFVKRLRDEVSFSSVDALNEAIEQDVAGTRRALRRRGVRGDKGGRG
jgi:riboflavin kinase/FMN adenylyltransferase